MDKIKKALVHKLLQYQPPSNKIERCEGCVWASGTGTRRLCPFQHCVQRHGWDFKEHLKDVKNGTRKP